MPRRQYYLQFNVISYGPQGEIVEVCFHGPGRKGFGDIETATEILKGFETVDKELNRTRIYEIQTVAVASDFESYLKEVYLPEGFHDESAPVGDLTDAEAKSLEDIIASASKPLPPKPDKMSN